MARVVELDIDLWHKRFGHINFPQLQEMQMKNIVFRLPKFSGDAYQLGKHHRLPFPNKQYRSQNRLNLIHSDVWGLAQTTSIRGSCYFVTFIDDYTLHTWNCLITKKSNVFICFLGNWHEDQVPEVLWRERVPFRPILEILVKGRISE